MHKPQQCLALVRREKSDGSVEESLLVSDSRLGLASLIREAEAQDGFLSATSYEVIGYFESDRAVERAINGID